MGKRELVALLSLSSLCLVIVVGLFIAVPWVCLQFVIVVFPDHTRLLFLYKWGLVVRIHFVCLLLPRKPILCFSNSTLGCLQADASIEYVTAPVSLTESGFMWTCHHLKNSSKSRQNIIGNVALSYQVNLAVENPYIFARLLSSQSSGRKSLYIRTFHLPTLGICNAYLIIRHVVGRFFFSLARFFFYSGWLGANRNVSGILGMKLAIV